MDDQLSDFERLVLLVRDAIADDTIEFGVFRTAESEHASLRRVVWIPTEFNCEPVAQTNPLYDPLTGEPGDTLHTDAVTVECQISGRNFADACVIRRQVCNAVNEVFRTSSQAADGVYQTEVYGSSGIMWGGNSKIIQRFVWMMNVGKLPELPIVRVQEIDLVDRTQVPASPPVLRLEEELAIKKQV